MAVIPMFGLFSGCISTKLSQMNINYFTIIKILLIMMAIDGIVCFLCAFTGIYKISFLVYLITLVVWVSLSFLMKPYVGTIMNQNFKHISGMASGIHSGGRNIFGSLFANLSNRSGFDGKSGNPTKIMYCIAFYIFLNQINYWFYWGTKNYDHL